MVLDIIIIVFVLMLAFIGMKRGIARTIYGIICLALAGVLAYLGGKALAEFVYNNFILDSITESVKTTFSSSLVNSSKLSEGVFGSIPAFLSGILMSLGITQKGFASTLDTASNLSQTATLTAVNKVISPVIISVISVAFIILFFIIFMLLLKLVIGRHLLKLFKLPVIKWVNSLLGGILGFGEGVLLVILAIFALKIFMFFSQDPFISQELIDSSYIFKSVYNWDFIASISNIIGL